MSFVLTLLVFLIILSVLVLIHELGHFIAAKRSGIKVEEFGFGLPPRLWGKKKGETIYSINWIPFGGFVRMLGEDSHDKKMLSAKRSFISKPIRTRAKVTVAGVFMNFLLAWLLLSIGFTVGMKPLVGSPEDIFSLIKDGTIVLTEGAKISEVKPDSLAEKIGLKQDDIVYEIDDKPVNAYSILDTNKNPIGKYEVKRNDEILTYEITEQYLEESGLSSDQELGAIFTVGMSGPIGRVRVYDVKSNGNSSRAGIRPGDFILSVNGEQIFSVSEYEELIHGESTLEYVIYREGQRQKSIVELDGVRQIIIDNIISDSPAEEAGLKSGDVIISVNGKYIDDIVVLRDLNINNAGKNLAYVVLRNQKEVYVEVAPDENGLLGIYMSELVGYGETPELTLYNSNLWSSIEEIQDVKLPLHQALIKTPGMMYDYSKKIAALFGDFVARLFTKGEISEYIAGPVGIFQMTELSIQDGAMSVIYLVALLSLSLAVFNILPIPALDGGRLLFLLIEFVVGKRINQKWEAYIHAFGFILLIGILLLITYNDILRAITG